MQADPVSKARWSLYSRSPVFVPYRCQTLLLGRPHHFIDGIALLRSRHPSPMTTGVRVELKLVMLLLLKQVENDHMQLCFAQGYCGHILKRDQLNIYTGDSRVLHLVLVEVDYFGPDVMRFESNTLFFNNSCSADWGHIDKEIQLTNNDFAAKNILFILACVNQRIC